MTALLCRSLFTCFTGQEPGSEQGAPEPCKASNTPLQPRDQVSLSFSQNKSSGRPCGGQGDREAGRHERDTTPPAEGSAVPAQRPTAFEPLPLPGFGVATTSSNNIVLLTSISPASSSEAYRDPRPAPHTTGDFRNLHDQLFGDNSLTDTPAACPRVLGGLSADALRQPLAVGASGRPGSEPQQRLYRLLGLEASTCSHLLGLQVPAADVSETLLGLNTFQSLPLPMLEDKLQHQRAPTSADMGMQACSASGSAIGTQPASGGDAGAMLQGASLSGPPASPHDSSTSHSKTPLSRLGLSPGAGRLGADPASGRLPEPSEASTSQALHAAPARATNLLWASASLPQELCMPSVPGSAFVSLEDFKLLSMLHAGHSSDVVHAVHKATGLPVVLKVYSMINSAAHTRVQLLREVTVMSSLHGHPNIIRPHYVFIEQGVMGELKEGPLRYNNLVIVMELAAGGSLAHQLLRMGGRMSEQQFVVGVLRPLVAVLAELHSRGIAHRDIKPANILFSGTGVLKLADFGLAVDLTAEKANTCVGTPAYMSPEVLICPPKQAPSDGKAFQDPGPHYGLSADVWSIGVLAYEALTGVPPFPGSDTAQVAASILNGSLTWPRSMSAAARHFISSCLEPHPGDRATCMSLLNHPLITKY